MVDFEKEILSALKNGDEYSKTDKQMFEENEKIIQEWESIIAEEEKFSFKPNKEDWEGIPSKKHYDSLPTTEEYMSMINDVFVEKGYMEGTDDITGKNAQYFSDIRGQIRAITDTKEEYEQLRDSILGAYKDMRKGTYDNTNMHTYVTTNGGTTMDGHHVTYDMLEKGRKDDVVYQNVPEFKSVGNINTNNDSCLFSAINVPCHSDMFTYPGDSYTSKYQWSLGKDGLMISKTDVSKIEMPKGKDFESGRAYRLKKFNNYNATLKAMVDMGNNVDKGFMKTDDYQNLKSKYPEIFDFELRASSDKDIDKLYDDYNRDKQIALSKYTRQNIDNFFKDFKKDCNNSIDKDVYDVFYVSNRRRK